VEWPEFLPLFPLGKSGRCWRGVQACKKLELPAYSLYDPSGAKPAMLIDTELADQ
jgi:hypothetical protein